MIVNISAVHTAGTYVGTFVCGPESLVLDVETRALEKLCMPYPLLNGMTVLCFSGPGDRAVRFDLHKETYFL